jgi:lipopolysaccharide/colanic/teichoic acid biosynthesis glycosyltransferase
MFAFYRDEIGNSSIAVNEKVNALKFIHVKESMLANDFGDLQLDLDLPVNSFDQALRIVNLSSSGLLPLPDAVLIDVPFHRAEFVSFIVSLKAMKRCAAIPVIYNAKHLSVELAKSLSQKDMIDDVMELDGNYELIASKVSFLKKVKNHPPIPHLDKEQVVKEDFSQMYQSEYFKRSLDILISSLLIAVSFPILIIIAIAIKLDSGGSVFYTSLRAGCRYKVFKLYKFRTMCMDADLLIDSLNHLNQYDASENSQAKFLKIINDPRITRVGKFLRKTSLDELPQLFNVLKGDMSLVGNRPLPLYEASSLTTNAYVPRFMAPAGITGLWQVTKRGYEKMSANERINLDILYAKKRSFFLDLKIMMLTPLALFQESDS